MQIQIEGPRLNEDRPRFVPGAKCLRETGAMPTERDASNTFDAAASRERGQSNVRQDRPVNHSARCSGFVRSSHRKAHGAHEADFVDLFSGMDFHAISAGLPALR